VNLLLAKRWTPDIDPTGWWMSEKLDGVRAYWDGVRFISRLGHPFHAPGWFTERLPKVPLDGELWVGRKAFQQTVSIVRRHDAGEEWKRVQYVAFDAPTIPGAFEERIAALHRLGVVVIPFLRCVGVEHLRERLRDCERLGGEGVMLRQPGSAYEGKRSNTLLKVKSFFDTDATVVGHVPGLGKHAGRLGALQVALADGTTFQVGTGFSDTQREAPPAVGEVVVVRYQELTDGGVPRFPVFAGVRADGPAALE
jgi:DNA ligase-1